MKRSGQEDIQTERRTKLDGGLDTRSGPFAGADKCTLNQNLSYREGGSLALRLGGLRRQLVNVYAAATGLQAPVLTAVAAGGTVGAATYTVGYVLTSLSTGAKIGASATANVVVGGGNNAIRIEIRPLNAGDGDLKSASGAQVDDPINGGFLATGVEVYALTGADALTKQTGVSAIAWDNTLASHVITMTSYTNNGAANPANVTQLPFRGIVYHPSLTGFIYWMAEQPMFAASSNVAPTRLTTAADRSNNATFFSRFPTKIQTVFFQSVLIAADGCGKPKRLFWSGSAATSYFQNLGCVDPAAPSAANNGAGVLTGNYTYRVAYVWSYTTPDGGTISFESNGGAISAVVAPSSNKVLVTLPQTSEPNITTIRIYRTTAGSTPSHYFLADVAVGTGTYSDNNADGVLLNNSRPQNEVGRVPNDPPPLGLYNIEIYLNRVWGVKHTYYKPTDKRIEALIPTNQLYFTKPNAMDLWPTTFNFYCGNCHPITATKASRGMFYVFKPNEIGVVDGTDESSFSYRTVFTGIGAMRNSVIEAGGVTYFWDNEKGPIALRGFTYDEVGWDTLQERWLQVRGTVTCRDAYYSKTLNELRWVFTSYDENPLNQAVPGTNIEFRVFVPTGAWYESYGATDSGVTDRIIMATTMGQEATDTRFQIRDVFWGDFYGRLVKDDQVEYDLDPSTIARPYRVDLVFFWGGDPEMVKRFRYIYLLFKMGATTADTLNIRAAYLAAQSLTLVKALTGADATSKDKMVRVDVPAALVGSLSEDRGMIVSIDGAAKSGPFRIKSIAAKFEEISDLRDAP